MLLVFLVTSCLALATTPQVHAYKQTVDVVLSNGHKVTVLFADDFPDSALSANIAYVQQDIPKIAELFYMPDHDFSLAYDTSYDPNGCSPPGAAAGYREFCVRANMFTLFDSLTVEGIVVHELTHVFQFETDIGSLSLEGSATAVDMIITHGLGYGQLLGGDVDYTAITPDNGPAIYLESQIALPYLLSNQLEKLYAYKPTIFREWTNQPWIEGTDPYAAILGDAVLDSKPLAQWLRDQGLESSNLQDGIYAGTYAALRNNQFYANVETFQQTNGNATIVTPQSVTCTLYTPTGQYITSAQAQSLGSSWPSAFCQITDPNITANTDQVRVDIHIDAAGYTLDRHVLAFKYHDIDPDTAQITASHNWVGLVGNDQLPIITTGTATINLQTVAGGTQTLQASIVDGAFKWPISDTYGVANIDVTTPTFQYHIQNFPFTYRPRGLTINPYTTTGTTTTSTTTAGTTGTATKNQLTVNVVGGPSDAVSVLLNPQTGDNQYDPGAAVQATPVISASGYSFDHWELDGVNIGAIQPYLIVMNAPHTLTAVFTAPQTTTAQTTTQPSTPTPTSSGGRCIIATAAYGSEMAPEVVYMRYVRDQMIGSTPTGKILRDAFNAFYYSWSPPVAQAISQSTMLQVLFRGLLAPLVVIIHLTVWLFTGITSLGSRDIAAVISFTVAAVFSTCTYIVLPALAIRQAWRYVLGLFGPRSRVD
jgi:hypothetical protein